MKITLNILFMGSKYYFCVMKNVSHSYCIGIREKMIDIIRKITNRNYSDERIKLVRSC